jgi:hypothetical protein
MKRYATALLAVLVLALGQGLAGTKWTFLKAIDPPGIKPGGNGYHGVAVAKDGRVWAIPYGVTDSVHDAINNRTVKVRCIYIYSAGGTLVDTIKTINMGTHRDTLVNSSRGINNDNNGNILYSSFATVYQINSATKAGMHSVVQQPDKGDGSNTACQAAADSLGEVFVSPVIDGYGPLRIFDQNLVYQGNVWDTSRGYSRCTAVNGTGNDVYFAGYTNNAIFHFHSANGSIGPYVLADTILKGMECESMAWNPKTHYLWVSAGNDANPPNQWPGLTTNYQKQTWYAYNTLTKKVVDSLTWKNVPGGHELPGDGARPRGIAFSPGGDTAYVACFNVDSACVQMFANLVTSIEPVNSIVPASYSLAQNFPNPFNPATEIQFTVPKAGLTTLRVFDILGREVATLVNENMNPGTFKVRLDGANLASGTYIYTLTSGEARITKKMMLLK